MKLVVFESIHKLWLQDFHYNEVAKQLDLSPTTTYSVINALQKIGYEEAKNLLVDKAYLTHSYTANALADITETVVSDGMTLWDAVFEFKIQLERLRGLVNLRNAQGCKLTGAQIISEFKWAGKLGNTKEVEPTKDLPKNVADTNHSRCYVPKKLTKEDLEQLKDQPRIFGKASKPVRVFRAPKVQRNKQVVAGIKQQKRLKQNIEAARNKLNNPTQDPALERNESTKRSKSATLVRARPASDFLDADGNYIYKSGRSPYVDPLSTGFDKLPDRVKQYSINRKAQDCELVNSFAAKSQGKVELDTLTRFKIFGQMVQEFPDVPRSRILRACGISPSQESHLKAVLERPDKYHSVKQEIVNIFEIYNGRAGRITIATMLRKKGIYLCDQTVRKLMKELELTVRTPKGKRYNSYQGEVSLCPNLMPRDFTATYQGEKLVTDVTMVPCKDKNMYVSACKDLFTKEVTISIASSPTTEFVLDSVLPHLRVLTLGLKCIVHSDQGIQYQSGLYQQTLQSYSDVLQSMSRKGDCMDNGECEAFFSTFKGIAQFNANDSYEVNVAKALRAVDFYNSKRIQVNLGGVPPTMFRILHNGAAPRLTEESLEAA